MKLLYEQKKFINNNLLIDEDIKNGQGHLNKLKHFFECFKGPYKLYEESLSSTAPSYNVFDLLNLSAKEAAFHTPFLANLLNPSANHYQRSLFINSFLSNVLKVDDLDKWEILDVKDEKNTVKGNIDLFVKCKRGGKPFGIIIENKIYANDQPRQLERYHDFLQNILRLKAGSFYILYLTPNGNAPTVGPASTDSISHDLYENLVKSNTLRFISYSRDILLWLELCLPCINAPGVKFTIEQYLKTIKSL